MKPPVSLVQSEIPDPRGDELVLIAERSREQQVRLDGPRPQPVDDQPPGCQQRGMVFVSVQVCQHARREGALREAEPGPPLLPSKLRSVHLDAVRNHVDPIARNAQ